MNAGAYDDEVKDILMECKAVDQAGCRGLRIGGAMVSPKHTNFLINTGEATAGQLEALGEEVRRQVLEKFGVTLQWEIRRIGLPGDEEAWENAA